MKNLASEIKKAVNAKCAPTNGRANLIVHLKDGQRIKIEVNAGDFYTPMVIAESFPNVAKAELEVY